MKKKKEEILDEADAQIMDWVYEVIKINFDVDEFIQDSTDLREILKQSLEEYADWKIKECLPEELFTQIYGLNNKIDVMAHNIGWNNCRIKILSNAKSKLTK